MVLAPEGSVWSNVSTTSGWSVSDGPGAEEGNWGMRYLGDKRDRALR